MIKENKYKINIKTIWTTDQTYGVAKDVGGGIFIAF